MCPITARLLVDPVVDNRGGVYEREALYEWLTISLTSPRDGMSLTPDQLSEAPAYLVDALRQWRCDHPDKADDGSWPDVHGAADGNSGSVGASVGASAGAGAGACAGVADDQDQEEAWCCAVCLEEEVKHLAALPCGHVFHFLCVTRWSESRPKKTCPLCQSTFAVSAIVSPLFFSVGSSSSANGVSASGCVCAWIRCSCVEPCCDCPFSHPVSTCLLLQLTRRLCATTSTANMLALSAPRRCAMQRETQNCSRRLRSLPHAPKRGQGPRMPSCAPLFAAVTLLRRKPASYGAT